MNLAKYLFTNKTITFGFARNVSSIKHVLTNEDLIQTDKLLSVNARGKRLNFPYVWLRDNCQCEQCFHSTSKSRIINWKHFDVNPKPKDVTLHENDIRIKWSDEHLSIYDVDWLNVRNFTQETRDNYTNSAYKLPRIEWDNESFKSIFKTFNFDDILRDDRCLSDWLETLSVYGVALVNNVESDPNSCRNLANRVDFIKRTHYGEEFTVKAKPGTTNVAYLSSNLQLHTDLPYYEYKPGVNLLHCVTQTESEGGENLLSDGLHAAKQLKRHNSEYYKTLTEIPIDWEDVGEENGNKFHSIFRSPVICEDSDGEIFRINYSTPQRGSHMNTDVERVQLWYESLKCFVDLIHKYSAKYKVAEGEILCFDNKRLLHGRTEYEDTPVNTRYVIGVYLDWDYINSRRRVLRQI